MCAVISVFNPLEQVLRHILGLAKRIKGKLDVACSYCAFFFSFLVLARVCKSHRFKKIFFLPGTRNTFFALCDL